MDKTRVLFLCIGNACRSPMAEGFARAYGSDVLSVQSAGLAPALAVVPLTHRVMLEKDIDLGDCFPKEIEYVQGEIDLLVNMSGHDLPEDTPLAANPDMQVVVWDILDPIGESHEVFCKVRDEIEQCVLRLIERVRAGEPPASQTLAVSLQVDSRGRPRDNKGVLPIVRMWRNWQTR